MSISDLIMAMVMTIRNRYAQPEGRSNLCVPNLRASAIPPRTSIWMRTTQRESHSPTTRSMLLLVSFRYKVFAVKLTDQFPDLLVESPSVSDANPGSAGAFVFSATV